MDPLHTPLCDLLGIRFPIIQAGMAGSASTPRLVAAVSNAGGLGVLGAARLPVPKLQEAIRAIRSQTECPFGVNFLLAPPETGNQDVAKVQSYLDRFRSELQLAPGQSNLSLPASALADQLEVVFEEKVPVLSVGLGDPAQLVASAHGAGSRVVAMVTTVEEAVRVAKAGVDVVVAQGAEAGGHRSTFKLGPSGDVPLIGTFALLPAVVEAVDVPVVAAGGIMDGRGLVAALALGAAGVLLGTRFLASRESGVFPAYKERLLEGTEVDTVVTDVFTGRPARALRNRLFEELRRYGPRPLGWPLQALAADDIYSAAEARNKADYFPLLAGQGLRQLKREQRAAEIVAEIIEEANQCLARLRATN